MGVPHLVTVQVGLVIRYPHHYALCSKLSKPDYRVFLTKREHSSIGRLFPSKGYCILLYTFYKFSMLSCLDVPHKDGKWFYGYFYVFSSDLTHQKYCVGWTNGSLLYVLYCLKVASRKLVAFNQTPSTVQVVNELLVSHTVRKII